MPLLQLIKSRLFGSSANIFEKHLQNFITYHLAPYSSIESLEAGEISKKRYRAVTRKLLLMALNLLRFLLIVALSQPSLSVEEESGQTKNRNYYLYSFLRSLLCEYFAGNQYGYLFHFVTASTLITPTSICKLFSYFI